MLSSYLPRAEALIVLGLHLFPLALDLQVFVIV